MARRDGGWNPTCKYYGAEGNGVSRGQMKLPLRAFTLILLLLGAAGTASASSVTLTLTSGGNDVMGGVYVGPYTFSDAGSPGTLNLICDDYTDEVYLGESWNANTSTLPTTGTTTTGLQFSSTATLAQYEEAAWLAQQIFALGPANSSNAATIGYMQYALWDIFTCGAAGLSSSTCASAGFTGAALAGVTTWFENAQSSYNTGNYSNVVFYTPTANGQPQGTWPQEYIGIIPTPEPESLLLLSAGLFSLVCLRRRLSY